MTRPPRGKEVKWEEPHSTSTDDQGAQCYSFLSLRPLYLPIYFLLPLLLPFLKVPSASSPIYILVIRLLLDSFRLTVS